MNNNPLDDFNSLGDKVDVKRLKRAKKPSNVNILATFPKKPRAKRVDYEHIEQVKLFNWSRLPSSKLKYPLFEKLLFAVPNGGYRSKATAIALKAEGVESGVSDILFLVASRGFGYLCIEMKYGKNKQSDNQKDFEKAVDGVGGLYQVCYSADEAQKLLEWYYADIKL